MTYADKIMRWGEGSMEAGKKQLRVFEAVDEEEGRKRGSLRRCPAEGRINNFIADHINASFISQRASMNSSRETLPSPLTSSSLNIEVISRRLTLNFGDRFKSSIIFRNYEKSMKLL